MTNKSLFRNPTLLGLMIGCGMALTNLQSKAQERPTLGQNLKDSPKTENRLPETFSSKASSTYAMKNLSVKWKDILPRLGGYIMGPSWHSDQDFYYNNLNFGGAITYRLGDMSKNNRLNTDLVLGAYHNSVRSLSVQIGAKSQYSLGNNQAPKNSLSHLLSHASVGMMAGIVTYPKYVAAPTVTTEKAYTNSPADFTDSDKKGIRTNYTKIEGGQEGRSFIRDQDMDSFMSGGKITFYNYTAEKTATNYQARGAGSTIPRFAAMFFGKINLTDRIGLMAQGGYVPKSGFVVNSALTIEPGWGMKRKSKPQQETPDNGRPPRYYYADYAHDLVTPLQATNGKPRNTISLNQPQ